MPRVALVRTAMRVASRRRVHSRRSSRATPLRRERVAEAAWWRVDWPSRLGRSDALVKFFSSNGYRPKGCHRNGLYEATAPSVAGEPWTGFRSTVPIILVANESRATFMRSLESLTLYLRFYTLREKQITNRIVNQLCKTLNVRWASPSSSGQFKGVPLYKVLVDHSNGDLRKATALFSEAMRAAQSRRSALCVGHKERAVDFLLLRRADCAAFFRQIKRRCDGLCADQCLAPRDFCSAKCAACVSRLSARAQKRLRTSNWLLKCGTK